MSATTCAVTDRTPSGLECNAFAGAYHVSVRDEPITISDPRRKGPKKFGPLLGLLVFMPLLMAVALVSVPLTPLVVARKKRKNRLLADAMRAKNRVMEWPEFVQALNEKRGTLIVEGDPFKGPNFWWTADNLRALSPHPYSNELGTLFDKGYRPFRARCYEHYVSPITGIASLVLGGEGQRWGFALGREEDEIGTGIFKDIPTILIQKRGR